MKLLSVFSRKNHDLEAQATRSMILSILFCLVCGLLLIFFGNQALRITAYVLAGIIILSGIRNIIVYLRSSLATRILDGTLATALILLVAGIMLAFNPDYLDKLLPVVWGLALLYGGFLKIQYAFDEKSAGVPKWWLMLIFAAFSLIIGILSLMNPEFLGENRNLIIGIMLLAESVLDITVWFLLRRALKDSKPSSVSVPVSEAPASAEAARPVEENAPDAGSAQEDLSANET